MSNALPDCGANECAAFPPALRGLSILIMVALWVGFAMSLPTLRTASWSTPSLLLFIAAGIFIVWMGYWLLHSRTRLDGDTLTQTWLWTKRVHAGDVSQMKLVHWPMVEAVMVPRLLVRQRNGALVWFQASDAKVLEAFMARTIAARSPDPSA